MKKKSKYILAAIICIVAILLVLQFVLNKPVLEEPLSYVQDWQQTLYEDINVDYDGDGENEQGWNQVVFPLSILSCRENRTPEAIFGGVTYIDGVFHYDSAQAKWVGWSPTLSEIYVTLHEIVPYANYWVHVTQDCTLTLGKC